MIMLGSARFRQIGIGAAFLTLVAGVTGRGNAFAVGVGIVTVLVAAATGVAGDASENKRLNFAEDAIGGTLARDHQSRGVYFDGEHRRTYIAYMDDDFYARVTYYDHESGRWLQRAKIVDDCIARQGWAEGVKDGHNVPNIFITSDGIIHLFYGSHGQRFKYARSKSPETITEWNTGMHVGKRATYPFLAETKTGCLLLFYRYGPHGGYNNPFLAVQRSTDGGKTYSDLKKLVTFPSGCKISRAAYDEVHDRVHLILNVPGPEKSWNAFHCMYVPASGNVVALNGEVLGPVATREKFVENAPPIGHPWASLCLHEGRPNFIFRNSDGEICFGHWNGNELQRRIIPNETTRGWIGKPIIYTEDGTTFDIYSICDRHKDAPEPSLVTIGDETFYRQQYWGGTIYYRPESGGVYGGDLAMWTTTDRGKTYSNGRQIIGRKDLGHALKTINRVMNYSRNGPLLIASEVTGPWPAGLEDNRHTHYDRPGRKYTKLYAIDGEGKIIGIQ